MIRETQTSQVRGWGDLAAMPVEGPGVQEWRVAPRYNELPPNLTVEGFTPEGEVFARKLLEMTGLPLQRVTKVTHRQNSQETKDVLATAHRFTGEVEFYKKMEGLPLVGQLGTAVHELTHISSPTIAENESVYGSRESLEAAWDNATTVASQTHETGRYLNGYHKLLHTRFMAGEITTQKFVEETNAIMMELRFTNPKHLKEVLDAQSVALFNKNAGNHESRTDAILNQIDTTLLNLMPQFSNPAELNTHIETLRANLIQQDKAAGRIQ